MPKYPYRDLGIGFDRNFRNDLNANFDDIEADIKELGAGAQQALEAAEEANTQAIYAQTSGDYANDKGDYAAQQGDYAKAQGDYAQDKGDYAKQVGDENKTRWLNPVATFADIATTYPNPQHGDTVMVTDDGENSGSVYRYENGQWNLTQKHNDLAIADVQNKVTSFVKDVNERLAETSTQLEDIAINVKAFGAVGDWDGTTGVDDTIAIKEALSFAIANNKKLLLPGGFHYFVTDQILIDGPVEIEFGKNAWIVSGYSPIDTTQPLIKIASDNVTIINPQIDGRDNVHRGIASDGYSNIEILGGEVKNVGMIGVSMLNTTKSIISNLKLKRCMIGARDDEAGSLRFKGGSDFKIIGVEVRESYGKGIGIAEINRGSIEDCTIFDTLTEAGDGLYLGVGAKNITARNIRVYDPQGNPLKISRGAESCDITESVFEKTRGAGYGILIQGGINCSVSRNKLHVGDTLALGAVRIEDHPDPEGSDCYGNKFNNNEVNYANATADTITVRTRGDVGSPYTCYDNELVGNEINGGRNGITSSNARGSKIEGNKINNVSNIPIAITGSTITEGYSIKDNIGKACKSVGINLFNASKVDVLNNTMEADVTSPGANGINIGTGCQDVTVSRNRVKGFSYRQIISTDATSQGVIISENNVDCLNNGSIGIEFRGDSARIVNNFIKNATTKLSVAKTNENIIVSGN